MLVRIVQQILNYRSTFQILLTTTRQHFTIVVECMARTKIFKTAKYIYNRIFNRSLGTPDSLNLVPSVTRAETYQIIAF